MDNLSKAKPLSSIWLAQNNANRVRWGSVANVLVVAVLVVAKVAHVVNGEIEGTIAVKDAVSAVMIVETVFTADSFILTRLCNFLGKRLA
jgi:hypothetical protein